MDLCELTRALVDLESVTGRERAVRPGAQPGHELGAV